MPGSKIEAELSKATKVKQGAKEDRQAFLTSLCSAIQDLSDSKWEALSDDAQEWANAAATAVKSKKKIKDFPDVGSVPKDEEEEDEKPAKKKRQAEPEEDEEEEEEEKPSKKKKPAKAEPEEEEEEDEDEDEKPTKKKKPAKEEAEEDEEEEEEEKPARKRKPAKSEPEEEEEEEEEEEKPAKKKPAKKPAKEEEEEEEEEDEKPAKKKKPAAGASKTSAAPKASGSGIKDSIKDAIFNDPEISVDDLVKKLGKSGAKVSKVTVSNIRAEYRHTIKFLKGKGAKGLEAK